MRRRAFALPAVLAVILLVVPVVFALALRSQSQLTWYAKLEDQARASLLAEEGEACARQELRAGGAATTGDRATSSGGMQWRLVPRPPGDDGQRRAFLAGEGIHYGEERLVVAFVEVFPGPPETLLIEGDREWILPDAGGGSPLDVNALLTAHTAAVERYLNQLGLESATPAAAFLRTLQEQSSTLDNPDVAGEWPRISAALARAKCEVN